MRAEALIENKISEPEQKKDIPLSWFVGIGTHADGIKKVDFSDEFKKLNSGETEDWMRAYMNHIKFAYKPPEDSIKDMEDNKDRIMAIQVAEEMVKKAINFSPKEISDKMHELEKGYKGKQEAPFELKFN